MGRATATDARMFWLSLRVPSDQFLLYAFDGETLDVDGLRRVLLDRARRVPGLVVRLRETPGCVDYPYWVAAEVSAESIRSTTPCTWDECLDRVAASFADQVDARRLPWRLIVHPHVTGVSGSSGPATVIVLQVAHALADGRAASALARALFTPTPAAPVRTRTVPVPMAILRGIVEAPVRAVSMVAAARAAMRADERRRVDTAAGSLPPPPVGRSLSTLSRPPGGRTQVRCVTVERTDLHSDIVSITVAALTVVSVALSEYLSDRGDPVPDDLGAEVTVAIPPEQRTTDAHNAFHNAGVDLHPGEDDLRARALAIGASVAERRRRLAHPAFGAGDRATETVPAIVIRRDVQRADLGTTPTTVAGHTVVSSVNRGPADLALDGRPLVLTAGFPALSPTVGITHGVHGIGEVVTLSIVTSDDVMDADAYADCLREAVHRVREALR